ncbi:uncharacterized protein [Diadema setosum]|uniref:uncharacterized protein n=1 Tax=Diadema setosum TaxID=31175 RepID=UPI003B3B2845
MTSEGCQVLEDSSPAVQTTMNSEDESRKWYSVQWADFKLSCERLKDVSSKHPRIPFWLYALYRFALAAYFFVVWLTFVTLQAETQGPKFLIYFPVWTYTATTGYVCFAFFNTLMNFVKSRKNAAFEDKFRYQIQWLLFNITAAPTLFVTALDWGVLYYLVYAKVPIFIYVSIGLLPAVVCLSEIFLTLIVVRFVHVWYSYLYITIFLLFAVIYWAAGKMDTFISPNLDFQSQPSIAAATVVGVTFALERIVRPPRPMYG